METPKTILERIAVIKDAPPTLKALIYGEPGVGKTVLAAQAPGVLLVDCERGARSLLNHPDLAGVRTLSVESFNDLDDLFWRAKAGEISDLETVVVDGFSELQRRNMDELLDMAAEKDSKRSPFLPFMADYKQNTEMMRRMVTQFRDLPYNLVITAHAVEAKDEQSGIIMTRPALTPKLAATLEGIFDIVGYMSMEQDGATQEYIRYLQVMPTRRIRAKTRLGGLPAILKNPTFNQLLAAINVQEQVQGA